MSKLTFSEYVAEQERDPAMKEALDAWREHYAAKQERERRGWIYESLVWAVLCALVVGATAGVPFGFVVVIAWCSLAGLARFVLENLR